MKTNNEATTTNNEATTNNTNKKGNEMKTITTYEIRNEENKTIKSYKTEKGLTNYLNKTSLKKEGLRVQVVVNNKDILMFDKIVKMDKKQYIITTICDEVIANFDTLKEAKKHLKNNEGLLRVINAKSKKEIKLEAKEAKQKEVLEIIEEVENEEVEIIKSNYNKKKEDKEEIKKRKEDIKLLDKANFALVNSDYAKLNNNPLYKDYTKKQKIDLLRSRYLTEDSQLNVICTLKEMNLSLNNELSIGEMKSIINLIEEGEISKNKVNNNANLEEVKTLIRDTKKAIKKREEKAKKEALKEEIKKELLTIAKDKKTSKKSKSQNVA